MKINAWIRHIHRWLSLAFTVAIVVTITAIELKRQALWIGLLALVPLIALLLTGLYMFVLPYLAGSRGDRSVPVKEPA